MSQSAAALTQNDIDRLMSDPSAATQMDVVAKLSSQYNSEQPALAAGEAVIAEDIFKLLLSRAEVQVRTLIAHNLKESNKLPPEIAEQMASDVAEVALPVLESCSILSDEYLLKVIGNSADSEKLVAIARRKTVSESVSGALVDTKIEQVVSTLVRNEGAQINEQSFEKIVENHTDSPEVMGSVLERGAVPITVVEKLVERISGSLKAALEEKYGNLVELTELRKAFDSSLEVTGMKLMGLKTSDAQLGRLINFLNEKGQLSPFSALCMANLQLFEVSLARLIRVPLKNVQQLLADPRGLRAIYQRAELPDSMFDAVQLCVQATRELEVEGTGKDGAKPLLTPFQVMSRMRQLQGGRAIESLDYLLAMMQSHSRDNIKYQAGS